MSFCKGNKKKLIKNVKKALPSYSRRIPSCARSNINGSYTLEAAVIFPLFAGFLVSILFFFRVIQVETGVGAALSYSSRMTAIACSATDSSVISVGTAHALFLKEISNQEVIEDYVSGGKLGISLLESSLEGDDVKLLARYKVKLPIKFFSVDGIWIEQHSNSHKWTGKNIGNEDDPYVYYTKYGTVYHTSQQCKYLDLSIRSVKITQIGVLRNKSGHKYSSCSCKAAINKNEGTVYITDYGTEYHGKLGCRDLKRTVMMVHLSEVGDKKQCSKCQK